MTSTTVVDRSGAKPPALTREAKRGLWGGILFSLGFTALIWLGGQVLNRPAFLPDQGASWYYWKLPVPTFWSRATAWGGYLLHQLAVWGLIFYAQTRVKRYTKGLHRVNLIALGANAFFILLHFVQTQLWYDGLAQDVSIWSSQGSVILMLVMILLMENRRRVSFGVTKPLSPTRQGASSADTTAMFSRGRSSTPSGITRWNLRPVISLASCICSC